MNESTPTYIEQLQALRDEIYHEVKSREFWAEMTGSTAETMCDLCNARITEMNLKIKALVKAQSQPSN